jgi:membrane-associated phospholipid phosphatase
LFTWAKIMAFGWAATLGSLAVGVAPACLARPQQGDPKTPSPVSKTADPDKPESRTKPGVDDSDSTAGTGDGLITLGRNFLGDQKQIWTSPTRLRFSDVDWIVPVGGFAAGLFATDRDVSTHLSSDPKTISHYNTLSTAGIASLVGAAGGMWLLGYPAHREHWRETGFLAGEAAVDSLVAVEALKYTLRRERPFQGDGSGPFFQGGTSFPSEHAAAAWSVAGVIAHEYPGIFPKLAAYGLASLVSYSRIRGRQHFNSDVFVGGLMGQMIAQDVYTRHYDPSLGGGEWRPLRDVFHVDNPSPATLGSPYVPLDSWVYESLDRLTALGLIDSGFAGMRPWTRAECARLVNEAQDGQLAAGTEGNESARLIEALQREFRPENDSDGSPAFRVESLYSRTEHISGMPLTDGYTFGQTQMNDFGRPYGQGWSTVNGFSADATWGRWVAYVRAEAQTAPSIPAFSLSTREAIEIANHYPSVPPGTNEPAIGQFEVLDAYVGMMLSNWQITFGKQSLWWGPGDGGPMMFSNNAEPINMFRVNRVTPLKLPSIFGWLGPMRTEFFLGQLAGYDFVFSPSGFVGNFGQPVSPQPFIHGEMISFKPTRNFEFGVFRTTVYGGPGYPLTLHTLLRSLFSTANEAVTSAGGSPIKPGDRRSGVSFTYRVPGLRRWVSFYGDGYVEDQFSPIGYADRAAWHAGLYFSQFPRVPKLDLRVEGVYTDNPLGGQVGSGYYYSNLTWRSGYTNEGNLIGSWIGREGQGAQAWTNYWFTTKNRLQLNFRHQKVSAGFIPDGGTLTDFGVRGDYWVRPSVGITASVQYERWLFPIIQPAAERDVAASIEIQFQPERLFHRSTATAETWTENGGRP